RRYHAAVHGMPVPYHGEANSILIDRHGRRFTDELIPNIGEVIDSRDPASGAARHLPAYVVTDARYLPKMPLVRLQARLAPGWLRRAQWVEELTGRAGVEVAALAPLAAGHRALGARGGDGDFGGGSPRAQQAAGKRKSGGLAPIVQPPFIAIRF